MVIVIGICFCFSGTSSPHNDSYSYQLMIWLRAHWHYCLKFIYVDELKQGFHLHHKAHCRWLEKLIQSPFGWFTNNCTDTLCSMTDYGIISKFCLNIMQISACYFTLIPLNFLHCPSQQWKIEKTRLAFRIYFFRSDFPLCHSILAWGYFLEKRIYPLPVIMYRKLDLATFWVKQPWKWHSNLKATHNTLTKSLFPIIDDNLGLEDVTSDGMVMMVNMVSQ